MVLPESPPDGAEARAHPRFLHGDLQVHTAHGDGMASAAELFAHIESSTDLDLIAVTDHDDVRGALEARELHARGRYSFALVPGIELTTRSGHLLALWVEEPIRSFRPLHETIAAIHRAGGVAVVPHPFSPMTRSVGRRALERVLALDDAEVRPVGIEVANATIAGTVTRGRPLRLNRERYGLAETGGSDAHFPEAVGSAVTVFEAPAGVDAVAALRRAIVDGTTYGALRRAPSLRQIGVRRLLAQQVIGLAVTPRKILGPPLRRVLSETRGYFDGRAPRGPA
jgi:predicted metal-dependent phosphoesterase TrpH